MQSVTRNMLAILVVLSSLSGCAVKGVDLVQNGTTSIDERASNNGSIVASKVEQYGETVLVRGRVARADTRRLIKGFVQVDVFNEKGVRIDTASSLYRFRHNGSHVASTAPFTARLNIVPPAGSQVKINHRDDRKQMEESGKGSLSIM